MQWDFTVLVLDNEKSELVVKSPVKVGKKSVAEEKVIAALKSHSEAERRRRERINAHLDTLRTLFPYREKVRMVHLLSFTLSLFPFEEIFKLFIFSLDNKL
ncbi:hypothetical protein ERO13_A08G221620v2 [Gossypium hirsutum]|uniref:BHLH domain-containing protein n=1 Tax=Gossypium barbadense TaxID=3634 RepID=A0A5J5UVK3_GOSBA|nr:hypothetical protein ES319_A08G235600v1 [Gossypium barbadense]KAG4189375.1 hypothetical protein ERO13_A08G221620v2 [Gossypium hirsutum]